MSRMKLLILIGITRIVLPVKKFLLPEDQVSQPIPTLSDRQFVVTKSNLTQAEEKSQRELFWYREELFKFIRGHWREVRSYSLYAIH
jgi:trafficking protein particle complex subunit 9